ncbi:MAG: hypothetical protein IJB55_03190 [Firmicutes bacterium]|nr:hypothetical protein [Bacillota bacterium]
MEQERNVQGWWDRLGLHDGSRRRLGWLGAVLVLGLLLMGLSSTASAPQVAAVSADAADVPAVSAAVSPEAELEGRLRSILSRIEGVGQVDVTVTFAAGTLTEYAVNASTTLRTTEENDTSGQSRSVVEQTSSDSLVLLDGDGSPVAVRQSMAEVQGVLVVAEGGSDPAVCVQISAALQNLLAVPAHKIVICPAGA